MIARRIALVLVMFTLPARADNVRLVTERHQAWQTHCWRDRIDDSTTCAALADASVIGGNPGNSAARIYITAGQGEPESPLIAIYLHGGRRFYGAALRIDGLPAFVFDHCRGSDCALMPSPTINAIVSQIRAGKTLLLRAQQPANTPNIDLLISLQGAKAALDARAAHAARFDAE